MEIHFGVCPPWRENLTGMRFALNGAVWIVLGYSVSSADCWVCQEQTDKTTCEFYSSQIRAAQPVWTVIQELRCPCESCAGELVEAAEVEEFYGSNRWGETGLRQALKEFENASPPIWLGYDSGDLIENSGGGWFTKSGSSGAEFQPACGYDGPLAWAVSLHPPKNITPASFQRLKRLLERGR